MSRYQHQRTSVQLRYGTILIAIALTIVSIILTFFALTHHNKYATYGYQIKQIQEQRSQYIFDIETLEMEIADLGALE